MVCFSCLRDFLLCPVSLMSPGPTWSEGLRASRSCSFILGQGRRDQCVQGHGCKEGTQQPREESQPNTRIQLLDHEQNQHRDYRSTWDLAGTLKSLDREVHKRMWNCMWKMQENCMWKIPRRSDQLLVFFSSSASFLSCAADGGGSSHPLK